jgi:hypothetical protein
VAGFLGRGPRSVLLDTVVIRPGLVDIDARLIHESHVSISAGATAVSIIVRNLRRAWKIRVLTVFTGHRAVAAISSHEYPMR